MIRPIGPTEPSRKLPEAVSKKALPKPEEFRLPEKLLEKPQKPQVTLPADVTLDHAKKLLKECPAQATLEVLNQQKLPEGKHTEKVVQEQTGLFLAQAFISKLLYLNH